MTPKERKALAFTLVDLLRKATPTDAADLVGPLVRSGDLDLFEDVGRSHEHGCSFLARWLGHLHDPYSNQQLSPGDLGLLDAWTKMPDGAWWNQPDGTARDQSVSLIEHWLHQLSHGNARSGQAEISAVMAHAPLPALLAWQPKPRHAFDRDAPKIPGTPGGSLLREMVTNEDCSPGALSRQPLPSEVLLDRGVSPKARANGEPVAAYFKTPGQWTRFLAAGGDAMELIQQGDDKPALPLWQHLYNRYRDTNEPTCAQLAEAIKAWSDARPEVKQALLYGDAAKYFWSVRNRGGSSREQVLTARRDWNTVVDSRGRNVLMHLLATDSDAGSARDLFSKRMAMPKAAGLVQATDFSGANLWHYLFAGGATDGHYKSMYSAITSLARSGVKPLPDAAGRGLLVRALLDPVSVDMENTPYGRARQDLMQQHAMKFDHEAMEKVPALTVSPDPWLRASDVDRAAAIHAFETSDTLQERSGLANLAAFFCRHRMQIGPEWASLFLESVLHHVKYAQRPELLDYLHAEGGSLTPASMARLRERIEVGNRLAEIKPILDKEALAMAPDRPSRAPRRRA